MQTHRIGAEKEVIDMDEKKEKSKSYNKKPYYRRKINKNQYKDYEEDSRENFEQGQNVEKIRSKKNTKKNNYNSNTSKNQKKTDHKGNNTNNKNSSGHKSSLVKDPKTKERLNRILKDTEPKKNTGYVPDNDKEAIRQFQLGEYKEEGKNMIFLFDTGTYSIFDMSVLDGEGKGKEVLVTRDKADAYKQWNGIKRPQKGKRVKEEAVEA